MNDTKHKTSTNIEADEGVMKLAKGVFVKMNLTSPNIA